MAGYVTAVTSCVRREVRRAIYVTLKTVLLRFQLIFLLFDSNKPPFFIYMCLIGINIANLCPNNKFDALDFSVCRSAGTL